MSKFLYKYYPYISIATSLVFIIIKVFGDGGDY